MSATMTAATTAATADATADAAEALDRAEWRRRIYAEPGRITYHGLLARAQAEEDRAAAEEDAARAEQAAVDVQWRHALDRAARFAAAMSEQARPPEHPTQVDRRPAVLLAAVRKIWNDFEVRRAEHLHEAAARMRNANDYHVRAQDYRDRARRFAAAAHVPPVTPSTTATTSLSVAAIAAALDGMGGRRPGMPAGRRPA